uniref:Uncharacterized protein n=2 Tax=Amniota TaxID=32524 RepID=A0A286Y469_CAVPO
MSVNPMTYEAQF